ncbi:MAG: mechanosensitive ion channel [Bacteroidales bacterium]|jgi:small-conductance mechanosensitive channel|nr:mechanosensitive ion channel [Bacteroidales bacterium]
MKDFFSSTLIDGDVFSLQVLELFSVLLIIGFWIFLITYGNRLSRKITTVSSLSTKHARAIKRFVFSLSTYFMLYGIFKIVGIPTEVVLQAVVFNTQKVNILVYHLVLLYFVLTGTRFLILIIEAGINRYQEKKEIEKGKTRSVFMLMKYFAYVLAISIFIQSLGFSITFLIASVSALLVGIGLGVQHFFNDIVSGIVILFDHSIKVGDVIEIEGELIGEVVETSLRTSKLVTRDDVIMIVPNSMFTSEKVINWSHNSRKSRFSVDVGVAYGSDVRLVEKILIGVANDHPSIEKTPSPYVFFEDFGNSSLDFSLKFFSRQQFRIEPIRSELRFEIDKRFRENNVTIPFPQQDVYIKQIPNTKAE